MPFSKNEIARAFKIADFTFGVADIWANEFGKHFINEEYWYIFNHLMEMREEESITIRALSEGVYTLIGIERGIVTKACILCEEEGLLEVVRTPSNQIVTVEPTEAFFRKATKYVTPTGQNLIALRNAIDPSDQIHINPNYLDNTEYIEQLFEFWHQYADLWQSTLKKYLKSATGLTPMAVRKVIPQLTTSAVWQLVMYVWKESYRYKKEQRTCIYKEDLRQRLFKVMGIPHTRTDKRIELLRQCQIFKSRHLNTRHGPSSAYYFHDLKMWDEITRMLLNLIPHIKNTSQKIAGISEKSYNVVPINKKWPRRKVESRSSDESVSSGLCTHPDEKGKNR